MKTLYTLLLTLIFSHCHLFGQCTLFQGPDSGNVFVNDPSIGTIPWNNPGNVKSSDNVRADAVLTVTSVDSTNYLKVSDFGFSIPASATICGIIASIECQFAAGTNGAGDNVIQLMKNNVLTGTNKAAYINWSYNWDVANSYGSNSDLWGATWTPADINNSAFGIAISARVSSGSSGTSKPMIDQVTLKVYYSTSVGVDEVSADNNISIYPSVSNGKFFFEGKLIHGEISIYNISGQKIVDRKVNSEKEEIDLSNSPMGIYFIRIDSGKSSVSKKIIVE